MCGGTGPSVICTCTRLGLSPRVRGNLQNRADGNIATGSIPACAGEPLLDFLTFWMYPVYPRVCGGTAPISRQPLD